MKKILGIELGSTRIKAVLINDTGAVIANGTHDWENSFENGYYTYSLDSVWTGVQSAFSMLKENVKIKTGENLDTIDAIGVSAMMHGYMPFDKNDNLLTAFRTWRNTNTTKAARELTDILNFNIPERWSIAHIYQAILNNETHVNDISYLTTLAGYVHWKLTGEKVLGVGDASGMFPIDSTICSYDINKLSVVDSLLSDNRINYKLSDILPKVLNAGDNAGFLTERGAKLLDISGKLKAGVPFCPPEGDAGTGMVATNSITIKTGNVSAGTSVFAMVVLEKALKNLHREIDMVTTPDGNPVAMAHCNTCTSDLDAWVNMFYEFLGYAGSNISKGALYDLFYEKALLGAKDCDGLVSYNYYAGEPVVNVEKGVPLFMRKPNSKMSFTNFARNQVYSTMSALKIGMDILFIDENVKIDKILGHGGLFKTPVVGQKLLAAALNVPVSTMENAGEGGPWGMALLALYSINSHTTLTDFLNEIFKNVKSNTINPDKEDVNGFMKYIENYKKGLACEKAASIY